MSHCQMLKQFDCHGQGCMAQVGWHVVIADESHTLRTSNRAPDARHTEAVASVVKRAMRAIFLSGTPSLSRPFDLFRQASIPAAWVHVASEPIDTSNVPALDIAEMFNIAILRDQKSQRPFQS